MPRAEANGHRLGSSAPVDVEEAFGDLIRGSSIVGAFLYDRQIKGGRLPTSGGSPLRVRANGSRFQNPVR